MTTIFEPQAARELTEKRAIRLCAQRVRMAMREPCAVYDVYAVHDPGWGADCHYFYQPADRDVPRCCMLYEAFLPAGFGRLPRGELRSQVFSCARRSADRLACATVRALFPEAGRYIDDNANGQRMPELWRAVPPDTESAAHVLDVMIEVPILE